MYISPEAREFIREALYDDECFLRVGRITVGGACSAKLLLGVSIDEEFDEEEDSRMMVDGIPVVMTKQLNESLKDVRLEFDPAKGVTVSHA